ncbi:MAG: hypothetical protein R3218_08580, partial [Christiangramia sp.]|nr:hypothetical protein [Christiangramia sp.]
EERIIAIYDPVSKSFNENPDFRNIQIDLKDGNWHTDLQELKSLEDDKVVLSLRHWQSGILYKVVKPEYDGDLEAFLNELEELPFENIYLRWLPNMELGNDSNPWGNRGEPYNDLLQSVHEILVNNDSKIKLLWSPSGETGLMEYFPSFSYNGAGVDLNSSALSLFRMRFNNKPLFIFSESTDFNLVEIKERLDSIDFSVANELISPENGNWQEELELGVYDLRNQHTGKEYVNIEHIFIDFQEIREGTLGSKLSDIKGRSHIPFISIEPRNPENFDDPEVMNDILNGKYDRVISILYDQIDKLDSKVYLRFAHEMEIPIQRYPWQSMHPEKYIKTYRYFMKSAIDKEFIKKIWGPAGDKSSMDYWPGEDYVDYISFAIYGLPDKNITDPKEQENFEKIYTRKSRRLHFLPKPFIIAEFGVKGADEFQELWMKEAANVIADHKRIKAANYFNSQDVPDAWGDIDPPDWTIPSRIFDEFVNELKKERHVE